MSGYTAVTPERIADLKELVARGKAIRLAESRAGLHKADCICDACSGPKQPK